MYGARIPNSKTVMYCKFKEQFANKWIFKIDQYLMQFFGTNRGGFLCVPFYIVLLASDPLSGVIELLKS